MSDNTFNRNMLNFFNRELLSRQSQEKDRLEEKNSLYHYTPSFDSIKGMVENKEVWLSTPIDCNDPGEENLLEKLIKNTQFDSNQAQQVGFSFDEFTKYQSMTPVYVFCMTDSRHDISQWKEYGNRGHGYCIKFSIKNMGNTWTPLPVIYDFNEQIRIINSFFNSFSGTKPKNDKEKKQFFSLLRYVTTFFKTEAYVAEKEWRVSIIDWPPLTQEQPNPEPRLINGQLKQKHISRILQDSNTRQSLSHIYCGSNQTGSQLEALNQYTFQLLKKTGWQIQAGKVGVALR